MKLNETRLLVCMRNFLVDNASALPLASASMNPAPGQERLIRSALKTRPIPVEIRFARFATHGITPCEGGARDRNAHRQGQIMKRFAFSLLLIVCSFAASSLAQTGRPNIVVILADDLGYGDVGFNGCPDIPTPNIDSLVANGVLCTNGYATHPFCSPSRAGLLTGRYQQRFGHENNPADDALNPLLGLSSSELLLPQLLKPVGYVSDAIGKWHLGNAYNFHPLQRGFDGFFGFLGGASGYFDAQLLRDETRVSESEYLTDAFTREAVAFINGNATQPFFLYLAYNAPHDPYEATQAYLDRVAYIPDPDRRLLAAMIVALDDGVGAVLQALQAQNLLDKTLIFFLSDNGAPLKPFTNNDPLRGFKLNTLEGGIRVPFAVQWVGRLPAGTIYDQPVSALDIVPTAAAVAGVALPTDRNFDGLNVMPYLSGRQVAPERTLYWRWFGLGEETGPPGSVDTIYAVRQGPLKLIIERGGSDQPPALYNLTEDIREMRDLALTQPNDVASLKALYDQWNSETIPPLWQAASEFPVGLVLAGDWNGYNIHRLGPPWQLTRVTAPGQQGPPDGFNWFISTLHVAATGGDTTPGLHRFVLVADEDYAMQWGGATITIDGSTAVPYYSGSSLGPENTVALQADFYYSFRILDPLKQLGTSLNLAVMKTSAPPVSVSRTGQSPAKPEPDDPVLVSIATNQPKSAEERIYLRWTTDSFITSNLVTAVGSGTDYSATIPAQPPGAFVQYSIITTTANLAPVTSSGVIDPLILSTTSAFNASGSAPLPTPTLTPTPPPPSIVTEPVSKEVTLGQTAKFTVVATGTPPLRYQWTKNGTIILGAIRTNYTTPSTAMADNGALFAVTVSNAYGSTTSNNATLTLKPPPTPPSITVQPADQTVTAGKPAKFSVTATGSPTLRYQWKKNGVNIAGETRRIYNTPPTTPADNGARFAVSVTNSAGSVTSNNAILTVQ